MGQVTDKNYSIIPKELKRSLSARFAAIYGIIALFFLVFIPVLPFDGIPLIQFGIELVGAESIIVTAVSFSVIFLVAAIVVISKMKNYGNGAIYPLHKFYSFFIVFYAVFYFVARYFFGASLIEWYIYQTLEYYFYPVVIAFSLGILFIQIAQISNKCMHINVIKTWHAVVSLIVGLGLSVWMYIVLISGSFFEVFFFFSKVERIIFLYMTFGVTALYAFKKLLYLSMPVNDCFENMYYSANGISNRKTHDSEISCWENYILLTSYFTTLIYFLVYEINAMFWMMSSGLLMVSGLIVWAIIYNIFARKKRMEEQNKQQALNSNGDVDVKTDEFNDVDDVNVSNLTDKNGKVKDCTVKPATFISGLMQKFLRDRSFISDEDAKTLFSALTTSRVIFIKGIQPETSLEFIEAIANAFETGVFADRYYQLVKGEPEEGTPEYDYALEVNRKKCMANGVFVANYLTHYIQPVFCCLKGENFGEYRVRLIKAIADSANCFRAGSHEELPQGEYYSTGAIKIPDNLWFIALVDEASLSTVYDKEIYRHAAVIEINSFTTDYTGEDMPADGAVNEFLSYEGVTDNLDEICDLYYLTEDNWRKIDMLLKTANIEGCEFDNKFVRQIETLSSLLIFFGKSQEEALDLTVAQRVIPFIQSFAEDTDIDWISLIDEVFGVEGFVESRTAAAKIAAINANRGETDEQ